MGSSPLGCWVPLPTAEGAAMRLRNTQIGCWMSHGMLLLQNAGFI